MKVTVKTHPVSGETTSQTVEVQATGATVADILEQSGLSAKKMNVSVNGAPARADTHVKEGASITLTEKARGS